jgi:hypothetical protein
MRIFKQRADTGMNVIAAPLASKRFFGPNLIKSRLTPAFAAFVDKPITRLHDMLEAGIVIGKTFEELAK